MKNTKLTPWTRFVGCVTALVLIPIGTTPQLFADQTWTNGTTDLQWATSGNWTSAVPLSTDNVIFGTPISGGSTITLGAGSVANALSFKDRYTLTGGDLTLTTGGVRVDTGVVARVDSILAGTAGLTLTGGGSLRLTGANTYTGITTISNGSLIIGNAAALGSDTSTIIVNGSPTRGFGGGSLVLEGGYGGGVTLTRGLSLSGLGPITDRGAALNSVGTNTVSGAVSSSVGATLPNTRILSSSGLLTLSGGLDVAGTAATTFTLLGGANSAGAGSYALTGALTGTGTLEKTGAGTLFLTPSSSSGFAGTLRVSTSATGAQSSVRITTPNVLGTRTATTGGSVIDMNGGILEVLMDTPLVQSGSTPANANVYHRANAGQIFVDHAPGSSVTGGTLTLGQFAFEENLTSTFAARNGYNLTFGAVPVQGGTANSTFTNNLAGGTLTFTGAFWSNTDTAPRSMTIAGNGNTLISGNFVASNADVGENHNLIKTGTGTLTISSTGGTLDGSLSVQGGTVAITDFRSINLASNSQINLGASGTGGTLNFGTATASTAAGLTSAVNGTTPLAQAYAAGVSTVTLQSVDGIVPGASISGTGIAGGTTVASVAGNVVTLSTPTTAAGALNQTMTVAGVTTTRVINLAGTTGGATINANQSGANPVIIAAGTPTTTVISAGGVGAKTLTLGGTSQQNNTINGAIVDNLSGTNNTSLVKTDGGIWQLAGVNTYSGSTTISGGTLRLIANAGTTSTIVAESATNTLVFGSNAATLSAGGTLEFVGFSGAATTETLGALTPTAGPGTVRLTAATVSPAATNLTFTSLGATAAASSLNFNTTDGSSGVVTFTTPPTAATATTLLGATNFQGHIYFNGADFADINGSNQIIAPTYAAAGNFQNAGAGALVTGVHNKLTAAASTAAAATISSLVTNSQTLTLGGNLTVSTGAILQSGGTATIQSNGATARTIGGAAAVNVVIRVDGVSDVLNLGASGAPVNIASATTGGFTKNGAGTLVINGTNAQTGTTNINEGTVRLGTNSARLSATSVATVLRQGATLDLNGQSSGVAIGSFDGAGTVTNSNAATAATLVVGNVTTGAGIFSGIIQDGAGVTNVSVTGTTGSPTWSGLNTYTGVTTIGTGLATTAKLVNVTTLANIGTPSSIGRGLSTSAATNAASLVLGGLSTAGISYTGTTAASTDRLFTLNASMAGGGGQIANASATNAPLSFTNTGAIAFGAGATVAQTLTLGGASTADSVFAPQITDNGALATALTKIGAGNWVLTNAANSYTGATTISAGVLQALSGSTLPTASNLVLAGGIFQSSGTLSRGVGTGSGQVSWTANGSGGFASTGSKLTVNWASSPVWGSTAGFLGTGNLVLGSATGLGEVEIASGLEITQGATASVNATTTAGSATVNLTSGTTAGLTIGQVISGNANIPANATIATIVSSTQFTLNSGTGVLAATSIATNIAAGGVRQVQVDDNSNTGADFATISGVVSGSGSLRKTGTGILQLFGANTYTGTTEVTAGTLTVNSLGNSVSPGASSVGTASNASSSALLLGNAGTGAGVLEYVGAGETSDRMIRLNTTTATNQIHASGSGALILTNVDNTLVNGAKNLTLRGSSAAGNMITNVLTNANAGADALSVTVDGSATWILSGANTFTGGVTVSAGALGLGNDAAAGTGTLVMSNGSIFAYGGDRVLANAATLANNTTPAFVGDYSVQINGLITNGASANNVALTNNIVSGKTLTWNNNVANTAMAAARTFTINGTGDTIITGDITTSTGFGLNLTYSGTGSLTLGGSGTGTNSDWNNGNLTVSSGTLKLGNSEVIPHGIGGTSTATAAVSITAATITIPVASSAGLVVGQTISGTGVAAGTQIASIVDGTTITASVPGTTTPATNIASGAALSFEVRGNMVINPAAGATATFDLNGNSETINGLTASAGPATSTTTINNSSASPASLTFGANDQAVTIGGGGGAYTISNSGGGALSLTKTGTGAGTISTGVTLNYNGTTTVNGGSLTVSSAVNGTTGLNVSGTGSLLALNGGITTPAALTSVSVGNGSTLNLLDGAGNQMTALSTLSLGSTGGTNTTLGFNVGDSVTAADNLNTDLLKLATGGTLSLFSGNKITFNLTDTGLNPGTNYVLLDASNVSGGLLLGPLTLSDYVLGATPGGFTSMTLSNSTDNQIILTTGTLITGKSWWNAGGTLDNWNDVANWSVDQDAPNLLFGGKAGTFAAASVPGQGTDVVFIADNIAGGAAITTTLEQNFKVNSLTFEASTTPINTPTAITINAGAVATSRLEVAPQVSTDGVSITTGGTPAVTIAAPFRLGAAQTWNVAEAASVLTLSGGLQGEADVTKTGAGKVTLSTAAASTFNTGLTTDVTVSAGTLELTNAGALGTTALANRANVAVNGGSFYYNNATSGTVQNNLTLGGGTLSAGGNAQTYSGTVNVSSNSSINLRDLNSAVTTTTQRNITLSGVLSGTGGIALDSIDTLTAGNAETGTLTINNGTSTWNGPLSFTRGTVVFTNVAGSGTATPYVGFNGDINFNQLGRVIYRNVDSASLNRTAAINFTAGALGEFSVDNVGALASNYTVTQSGVITLGAGGTGATARFNLADAASNLIVTGGVVLNGNSSISVEGGDADSLVSINTTGISGTGNLAINDEAGVWAVTSTRLAINAASTFTGNTTLNEGTLILGHKDALSTGSLTITGASTIQAGADLSGANAVANALTLNNNLTVSGSNNLTISGTFSGTGANADRTLTNSLTAGTLVLSGTTINIGATGNTAGRTLTINGSGNTEITGQIVNNTAFANALLKGGAGTLTLSNSTNSYTGATTINAGTLKYGANSAITSTSAVTVNANAASTTATLDLNGFSGTIGALTLGGTSQTATSASVVQTGVGTLTLGGNVATSATGNPTTTPIISGNLNLGAATRTFTVANSTGSAVDLDVQAVVSGTGVGITKAGAGVLQLSNVNTYTGATTISPAAAASLGVILATANNALGTGAVTSVFTSGATTGQIQLSGGITLGNSSFTTSGVGSDGTSSGVIRSVSGSNIISGALNMTGGGGASTYRADTGATLTVNGNVGGVGAQTNRIINLVGGGNFVFNGNITNTNDATSSTVGLDVGNTGTTTLSGTNTFTLATTVQTGATLVAGSTGALSPSSAITNSGTIRLNGFSNSVPSLAGTGVVENANASAAALSVGAGNTTSSLSTLLQDGTGGGTLGLTKIGTGTVTLSGTNTFTGKTTVANGTISTASLGSLGAHADLDLGVAAMSSGTLLYSGAADTLAKNINALGNGSDTIQNSGTGLLTLSGTLTKDGTTLNLNGGTSGILVTGTIVGPSASSDLVIAGGVVTLGNANTYNGPTILNAGVLNINNANAISNGALSINGGIIDNTSGSAITLASNNPLNINADFTFGGTNNLNLGTGAVTLNANRTVTVNGNTLTIGGTITGNFNLTGAGAGTLLLTGASTYTGSTTVSSGSTVTAGGNGSLGDTSSGTTITTGGALVINNINYSDPEPLTLNGSGIGNSGALVGGSGTSTFAGPITIGTDATIGAPSGGVFTLSGGIDKTGTVVTFTGGGTFFINGAITGDTGSPNSDLIVDATTVNLNAANTYNGPTYVRNGGVLYTGAATALPTSPTRTALIIDATGSGGSMLVLANGFSQSVLSLSGASSSMVQLNSNNLTIGAASGSTIYAGSISGTGGSLVKDLDSTLTLDQAASYTGGTTVNGGTLNLRNTADSATGTGGVTVGASGTLSGTGSIAPAANNSIYINGSFVVGDATLGAPVASTFGLSTSGTGSTVMGAGSSMSFDLFSNVGDNSPFASAADYVNLTGSLDLTAASTLILTNPNNLTTFALGDKWKLFSFTTGSIVGVFTGINDSALNLATGLYGSFTTDAGGGYYVITNVPEPYPCVAPDARLAWHRHASPPQGGLIARMARLHRKIRLGALRRVFPFQTVSPGM